MTGSSTAAGEGREGPCLRCTISAIVALLIGAWMTMVLVRSLAAVVGRIRRKVAR